MELLKREPEQCSRTFIRQLKSHIKAVMQERLGKVSATEDQFIEIESQNGKRGAKILKEWEQIMKRIGMFQTKELMRCLQRSIFQVNQSLLKNQIQVTEFFHQLRRSKVVSKFVDVFQDVEDFERHVWQFRRALYITEQQGATFQTHFQKTVNQIVASVKRRVETFQENQFEIARKLAMKVDPLSFDTLTLKRYNESFRNEQQNVYRIIKCGHAELRGCEKDLHRQKLQELAWLKHKLRDSGIFSLPADCQEKIEEAVRRCEFSIQEAQETFTSLIINVDYLLSAFTAYLHYAQHISKMFSGTLATAKKNQEQFHWKFVEITNVHRGDELASEKEIAQILLAAKNTHEIENALQTYSKQVTDVFGKLERISEDERNTILICIQDHQKKTESLIEKIQGSLDSIFDESSTSSDTSFQNRIQNCITKQNAPNKPSVNFSHELSHNHRASSRNLLDTVDGDVQLVPNSASDQSVQRRMDRGMDKALLSLNHQWKPFVEKWITKQKEELADQVKSTIAGARNKHNEKLYNFEERQNQSIESLQNEIQKRMKHRERMEQDIQTLAKQSIDVRMTFYNRCLEIVEGRNSQINYIRQMKKKLEEVPMTPEVIYEIQQESLKIIETAAEETTNQLQDAIAQYKAGMEDIDSKRPETLRSKKDHGSVNHLAQLMLQQKKIVWERAMALMNQTIAESSPIIASLMQIPERHFLSTHQIKLEPLNAEFFVLRKDYAEFLKEVELVSKMKRSMDLATKQMRRRLKHEVRIKYYCGRRLIFLQMRRYQDIETFVTEKIDRVKSTLEDLDRAVNIPVIDLN